MLRNRAVFEIARNLRAFLNLDVGLTHGVIPDYERMLKQAESQVKHVQSQIEKQRKQSDQLRKHSSQRKDQIEQLRGLLRDKDRQIERLQERSSEMSRQTNASFEDVEVRDAAPAFSIVVPTYNRADMLRRAVESALNQEGYDDYEILVVDDRSDDGTWEYLQSIKDPKLTAVRNPRRLSMGPNWNKAVRLSKGRYVYILQDDDLVLPNLLAQASEALARHGYVNLICFASAVVGEDDRDWRIHWQPKHEELLLPPEALLRFSRKWTLCSTQVIFSRVTFDLYGNFDETPPIMSDAEAILRWMIHGRSLLIPDALALKRVWPGQVTTATQYTLDMIETMTFLVDTIRRLAANSGYLDPIQIHELKTVLPQTFVERYKQRLNTEHLERAFAHLRNQSP